MRVQDMSVEGLQAGGEESATSRTSLQTTDLPVGQPTSAPPRIVGGTTVASTTRLGASADALLREEMGRVRVTSRVLMLVVGIGTVLVPFMRGEDNARRIMAFGLVLGLLALVQIHRIASCPVRYNLHQVGALSLLIALSATAAVNFFGVFSPAPMLGSLGLYIFSLGSSAAWSAVMLTVVAGGHALLVGTLLLGLRADPGLLNAGTMSAGEQLVISLCVISVYGIALGAARAARGKLVGAVHELEAAVRKVSERDAQLGEARRELERSAWVGGEGRFTHQQVGSFRLGNVIGRGGMGEVYDAEHVGTGAEAAVKLLQRGAFGDPASLVRFAREARAAASLDSEHVVRVLEVPAEDAPVPYLAMERLRGEDLSSLLRREKRLSCDETLRLMGQVGAALDAARRAGIVHRDLKPQNIFMSRGEAGQKWKVLDFGVSKLLGQHSLTNEHLVGTPEYMAPEQAKGDTLDHRADLYALAAVAYRCLTGRPPFSGRDLATTVYRVVNEKPVQPSHIARVSTQVEAVLAIGLSRSPEDRFDSGRELARAFEDAVVGELGEAIQQRGLARIQAEPWHGGHV